MFLSFLKAPITFVRSLRIVKKVVAQVEKIEELIMTTDIRELDSMIELSGSLLGIRIDDRVKVYLNKIIECKCEGKKSGHVKEVFAMCLIEKLVGKKYGKISGIAYRLIANAVKSMNKGI